MTSDVISAFDVSRELEEKNDNGEIIIPKNKQTKKTPQICIQMQISRQT